MATRWANPEAAREFRKVYAGAVAKRYTIEPGVPGAGVGGVAGGPTMTWSRWNTATGPVELVVEGDTVIAIESVPPESMEKVRQAALGN